MKAALTKEGGLELIAEGHEDESTIKALFDRGHLHLVCKSWTLSRGRWRLLLTISVFKWRMVKP